jgi:hypothetical protein
MTALSKKRKKRWSKSSKPKKKYNFKENIK